MDLIISFRKSVFLPDWVVLHSPKLCFSKFESAKDCGFVAIALPKRLYHPPLVWGLVTRAFLSQLLLFSACCKGLRSQVAQAAAAAAVLLAVSCWLHRFIEDTFRSSRSLIGWSVCCTWGKPSDVTTAPTIQRYPARETEKMFFFVKVSMKEKTFCPILEKRKCSKAKWKSHKSADHGVRSFCRS